MKYCLCVKNCSIQNMCFNDKICLYYTSHNFLISLVVNLIKAHAMNLIFPFKLRVDYNSLLMEFPRDFSILPYWFAFVVWLPYEKTMLAHNDIILGQTWLFQYDPMINFKTHTYEIKLLGLFNKAPTPIIST